MKTIRELLLLIFISSSGLMAQTLNQSFLFDFGPLSTNTADGDITVSPDWHGNYWNNISGITAGNNVAIPTGTNYPNLVNTINQATTYALNFNSTNTFRTNGKVNGGLRSPYGIQFGADSVFDIATATVDYIFTQAATLPTAPSFKISGLNTSKTYRFKIFGCRNTNIARTSFFNLQGAGSVVSGTLNTSSVAGLGGTVYFPDGSTPTTSFDLAYKLTSQTGYTLAGTYYGNNNSVYTSDYITPNASGEITISVYSTSANAYAYINCMSMEEYTPLSTSIIYESIDQKTVSVSYNKNEHKLVMNGLNPMFNYEYSVYGTDGKIIYTGKRLNGNAVDIESCERGVSIINLKNKQTQQEIKIKFVK